MLTVFLPNVLQTPRLIQSAYGTAPSGANPVNIARLNQVISTHTSRYIISKAKNSCTEQFFAFSDKQAASQSRIDVKSVARVFPE